MNLKDFNINKDTTLFLDRDGVINKLLTNDYVKSVEEFCFNEGVLECFADLSKLFGKVIVVTNQQGIGKGIMNVESLEKVHRFMASKIFEFEGRIDQIYFCPATIADNNPNRKPEIGMALEAKKDYPDIDFQNTIMVGDSQSDIDFGINAGMKTILITNGNLHQVKNADSEFNTLKDFIDKLILEL